MTVALLCVSIAVVYGVVFVTVRSALARQPAVARVPSPTPTPAATYYNELDFAGSVPIADRRWIVQAVAHARPEAVRLIELIDDGVTVTPLPDKSALGRAHLRPGRNRIRLDLEDLDGPMRANRELVVLHELGHVIDRELVPRSVRDRLADEVPASGSCPAYRRGDCAPRQEKFADTFALWAFRGARSYRYGAGYHLLVPPSLDAWGTPLTRLASSVEPDPR